MPNPRDGVPQLGVPVDPWTGFPMKPVVLERLKRLKDAEYAFRLVLHELDGSSEGSRPGDRRMAVAFTKLDEVMMWVAAALMDH